MEQSEARSALEALRARLNKEYRDRNETICEGKDMRRLFAAAEQAVEAFEKPAGLGGMADALRLYPAAEQAVEAAWKNYHLLEKAVCISEVLRLGKSMRLLMDEKRHPHFELRRRFDPVLRARVQSANDSIAAFTKFPEDGDSGQLRDMVTTAWDRVNAAWDRCKAIDAEKGLKPSAVLPEFDGLEPKLDDLGTIEVLVTLTEAQFAAKYDAETAHKIWLRMLPADQRKAIKTAAKPTDAPVEEMPEKITAPEESEPVDHEPVLVEVVIGAGDEASHYTISVNGNGLQVEPAYDELLAYLRTQIDGLDASAYVKMMADDPNGSKTLARGFAKFVKGGAKSPKRVQKKVGHQESAVREEGEGKKAHSRK